jgi:hypothetical protein
MGIHRFVHPLPLRTPQGLITTLLYVAQQPAAIVPLLAMLCEVSCAAGVMVASINGLFKGKSKPETVDFPIKFMGLKPLKFSLKPIH